MKSNKFYCLDIFLIYILFISGTEISAQNYFPWYKTYGESGRAIDIYQTVDSGYVIAGENYQYSDHRVWLLYTDSMGDTLWSKTYDNICDDDDHLFVRAIIQTADGGYAILSNCIDQYLTTKYIKLLKTDKEGNLEFLKSYYGGYVYDFLETPDSGLIIVGEVSNDTHLLKVNSHGDSVWSKIYEFGDRSYAQTLKKLNDSEYVVAGSVEVGIPPADKNVYILKINSTGDTLISKIFENPNSNDFVGLVDVTYYGDYIIAGRADSHDGSNKIFIMRVDSNFNEVRKTYTESNMPTTGVITYKSNSFLLVGHNAGPPYLDIAICEIDSIGNILYSRLFDVFSGQHAYSVIKKTDTSYVIVGDINGGPKLLIFEGTDNPIITTGSENIINSIPIDYYLSQNHPNPFNPTTTFTYNVPVKTIVSFKIYSSLGEEIAELVNEEKPAGKYEIKFDATGLPSGVYFYRLQAGYFLATKKMVLLR